MNTVKARRTITINEHTFQKLRGVGTFGESYSDLILRLVESVKSGGNIEMNAQLVEFKSKLCKQDRHWMCSRQWTGFGFDIFCRCNCHKRKGEQSSV